jgi:tetratricopeptide (TPR) repeat protein
MNTLRRTLTLAVATLGLATITFGIATAIGQQPGGPQERSVAPPPRGATAPLPQNSADVDGLVRSLQAHLASQPKDARSWSQLGLAYVEQTRLTGDPSYYPKAERTLERSLAIQPKNNDTAFVGLGALAAGRHEFAKAAGYARDALAINPESPEAHGVLADALSELGQYDKAFAAAKRMDDLRPSLASRVRLAYQRELRGDVRSARLLLNGGLDPTMPPADAAYVHGLLGDLAWSTGRLAEARRHYTAARAAQPGDVHATFGSARVAAATGDLHAAIEQTATVVARQPTVEHLRWHGELLAVAGRTAEAREQYDLARTAAELHRAQGVTVDLEVALFEADHGNRDRALAAARTALDARPSVFAEDGYAWALHVAGRDREALVHAERAGRLGMRSAQFAYHKGMIELALGLRDAGRADLERAVGHGLTPLDAKRAAAALETVGGAR